ncbi:hypothetical protein [Lapidilactobacillus bayanensis]|uniref:hypothetical protein n=1 Tax=Lapidilactobacillus bayanensis TaxID=2485998 RepID=UPI000F77911D|nr:hypothetical protein [Lapidilactobacillus bayanensis]
MNGNQRVFREYLKDSMARHSHDMVRSLQAIGRYAPPEVSIPFSRLTTSEKNQVIYEVLKDECEK